SDLLAASCSDLSHRREEVKNHNQQKKRAERSARLSKQQGKLAANINHDLRTGLNSISLLSKALNKQESGLNDKQQAYVDNIHHTSIDLLELVDEALALARIQPAKTALSFKEINIPKVCQRLESLFSPIARENSLSFSYNTSDECPETITTNALCLQRILKNLISNAFKFTEEGSVTLNIYSPADTEPDRPGIDGNNNIAFQIQDTGIGIPEEKQNLIFQRFQQAETSVRDGYRGLGLGLAICQDLTQQLGGTLQVQSTPGQGSSFTLYLPQEKATSDVQDVKAAKR